MTIQPRLIRSVIGTTLISTALLLGACSAPGSSATATTTVSIPSVAPATPSRAATPSPAPSTNTGPSAAPGGSTTPAGVSTTPVPTKAPASTSGQKYVVQAGDTLSGIADKFGVTIDQLITANKLQNPDLLMPGQELVIPAR